MAVLGRALHHQRGQTGVAHALAQLADHAGFADASLARQHHGLPLTLRSLLPPIGQQGQLLLATHERAQAR